MEKCSDFFCFFIESWSYAEPIIGYSALIVAIIYGIRVRIARRKKYKNIGVRQFIVALQIGRPVAEAVKAHFGELDFLLDSFALLGKAQLESQKDYKKISVELYKAMAANQNCQIKLILSGPVGLSILVGQLVGLAKFDVEVFQYDPLSKGYMALPVPDRTWL